MLYKSLPLHGKFKFYSMELIGNFVSLLFLIHGCLTPWTQSLQVRQADGAQVPKVCWVGKSGKGPGDLCMYSRLSSDALCLRGTQPRTCFWGRVYCGCDSGQFMLPCKLLGHSQSSPTPLFKEGHWIRWLFILELLEGQDNRMKKKNRCVFISLLKE